MRIVHPTESPGMSPGTAVPTGVATSGLQLSNGIESCLSGFHPRLSYAAYEADDSLRISTLNAYVAGNGSMRPDSSALAFGRAFHHLALTPTERLDQVLSPAALRMATEMAEAFRNSSLAKTLLSGAFVEASFFWDDPATNVACKARLDIIQSGHITDLKSTRDLRTFRRDADEYGYFRQGPWYVNAAEAVMGEPFKSVLLVGVEKKFPYAMDAFEIPAAALEIGRRQNAVNLASWSRQARRWGAK